MKDNSALTLFGRDEFLTPFDRIFDKMMKQSFPEFGKEFGISFFEGGARPKVDIKEYDDKVQIQAEIAGLSKDDVNVEIKENILTISGEKQVEKKDDSKGYILRELSQAKFQRSFDLGDNLDSKNITAEFNHGVLTLNIPKLQPQKKTESYKIEIK
jgi:HSP20 family protein